MIVSKTNIALGIVLFTMSAASIPLTEGATQQEQLIAGITIKARHERHAFGAWFVELVIPRQSYSKENLESIWRYYCEKYQDLKDRLDVRVYTESEKSASDSLSESSYDAIFYRQGEGAIAGGGDNQFYTYRPNLDKPNQKQNVQLKGRYPFLLGMYTGNPNFDFVVAAGKGDKTKLSAFLKEGLDVNTKDDRGRTALMAACRSARMEIVDLLLAEGADVNSRDKKGDTALVDAVMAVVQDSNQPNGWRWGQPAIVRILLDNGADVNVQKHGWTPLLCAVSHGSNDIVRMLLIKGADMNAKTDTGMSALARAIYDGRLETFEILLEAGADVDSKDHDGNTPLMRAASGNIQAVRALLEKGAVVNIANIWGDTAVTIAKRYPHNEPVIKMLLSAGAKE